MKLKYSNIGFTPKEINEDNYSLRAVFSTADVDRHGEVVDQKSWILDDFMKNPVVLFSHDHHQPPVGKVTGLGYNQDGDLEGEIQFAAKQYPFANVLWNLYKDGFMKAFSVGFSSQRVDVVDEQVILKENTLYEISTVSVPANAMALAKSKGLNTDPLSTVLAEQLEASLAGDEKNCPDCNEKGCACNEPKEEPKKEEEAVAEVVETATEEVATATTEAEPEAEDTETVADTTEEDEEKAVEDAIEKGVEAIVDSIKEGRVLSKANRSKVQSAVEALQALLDADNKEDKSISDNNTADFIKVETPAVRVSVAKSAPNKNKAINRAIRALLAEKSK